MHKTKVAVVRGGISPEYDVSLQTGSAVLRNLPEDFHGIDIFIDKRGMWHRNGMPMLPYRALKNVDVVWNALHGEYGEDGKIQRELAAIGVPFTGPHVLPASISMSKALSKDHFRRAGLQVPHGVVLRVGEDIHADILAAMALMSFPLIVKPSDAGSSVGVTLAQSNTELEEGVRRAFNYSPKVLVEEYIPGTEATVGVIENFRDEELYSLAPIEIRPTDNHTFFNYDAKYKKGALEISPGNFHDSDVRALREFAKLAHHTLGLRHYSRSDFIVSPGRGIYILETNSLPGLTPESLIPKALQTANVSFREFLSHILSLAVQPAV
jgi:D-alanine-D-alanine ligase